MKLNSLLMERVYAQLAKTTYQGDESTDPAPKILVLGTYTSTRGNRCLAGITLKAVVELFGADGIKILQKYLPDILGYSDLTKKPQNGKKFESLADEGEELHPRPLKSTGGTVGRYDMGAHYIHEYILNRIFNECYRTWIIGKMGKVSTSKMYTNDPEAQLQQTPETPEAKQLQKFDELPTQDQLNKSLQDLEKAAQEPEKIQDTELPTTSLEKDQPEYPTVDKPLAGKPEIASEPDVAPKVVDPGKRQEPQKVIDISDKDDVNIKPLEAETDTFIKPSASSSGISAGGDQNLARQTDLKLQKPTSTTPPSSTPEEKAIADIAKAQVNAAQDNAEKSPLSKPLNIKYKQQPRSKPRSQGLDDLL